jgi:hypothetical protein
LVAKQWFVCKLHLSILFTKENEMMLGKRKIPLRLLQYFSQVIWNPKGEKKIRKQQQLS